MSWTEPKFIITLKGDFRMGMVRLHRDLLKPGDVCLGGGFYEFDRSSNRLMLDDISTDYGEPRWNILEGNGTPLRLPEALRGLTIIYQYDDYSQDYVVTDRLTVEYV